MKLKYYFLLSFSILFLLSSCSDDESDVMPVLNSSGLENNELELKIGEGLTLAPKLNTDDVLYQWSVNERITSNEAKFTFKADEIGAYKIVFTANNSSGSVSCEYKIQVGPVKPVLTSKGLDEANVEMRAGETLKITPVLNIGNLEYKWLVNEIEFSNEASIDFKPTDGGKYHIVFSASNSSGSVSCEYNVQVNKIREKTGESSAYLKTLFEYKPAPGQYVNEGYGLMKDADAIIGKPEYAMVTLGGFGGYISVGFDHTLIDTEGDDFIVYGNAFKGSSEAGIVMVSFDYNGNGLADDEWYELGGSEYNKDEVIHNYTITYTNPKAYADVPWSDNQGNTGFVKINDFHNHNYYPEFIDEQDEITFKGTLLPNNKDINDMGWIVYNEFEKGYVDNYSEEYEENKGNKFDISWAVSADGEKVELPGVDFIKIYTAVNIDGGILGEASTEVMGAADLSLLDK